MKQESIETNKKLTEMNHTISRLTNVLQELVDDESGSIRKKLKTSGMFNKVEKEEKQKNVMDLTTTTVLIGITLKRRQIIVHWKCIFLIIWTMKLKKYMNGTK